MSESSTIPAATTAGLFKALVAATQAVYNRMHQLCDDDDDALTNIAYNDIIPTDLVDLLTNEWNPLCHALKQHILPALVSGSASHSQASYPCTIVANFNRDHSLGHDRCYPSGFAVMATLICLFFTWNSQKEDMFYGYLDYNTMQEEYMEMNMDTIPIAFYAAYHNRRCLRSSFCPQTFTGAEEFLAYTGDEPCLILDETTCPEPMLANLVTTATKRAGNAPIVYWQLISPSADHDEAQATGVKLETRWVHNKMVLVTGQFDLSHLIGILQWGF